MMNYQKEKGNNSVYNCINKRKCLGKNLTKEMKEAAANLDFERAMQLRDIIFEMESN